MASSMSTLSRSCTTFVQKSLKQAYLTRNFQGHAVVDSNCLSSRFSRVAARTSPVTGPVRRKNCCRERLNFTNKRQTLSSLSDIIALSSWHLLSYSLPQRYFNFRHKSSRKTSMSIVTILQYRLQSQKSKLKWPVAVFNFPINIKERIHALTSLICLLTVL